MGIISKFVANIVTKKGDSPLFDNPKNDFGLDYQDVTFKTEDGILLSGWLVNPGQGKVIIQTHFGVQGSRSGYTPKGKGLMKAWNEDIRFLKHTKSLAEEGYTILMYDLRNHGNSAEGNSEWITGGVEEYKDVIASVNYITNHEDYKNAPIGLLSICMGCNSTTYAYGIKGGLQEFKNIKAMIAIQPLGLDDFLDGLGLPDFLIEKANKTSLSRGGVDFHESCLNNVKDIKVPTLLFQNAKDPYTNMDFINDYYDQLQVEKELFMPNLKNKRLSAYAYFGEQPEKMLEWFNKHV